MVCTTRPSAPAWTSSVARVIARTSKRSEKLTDQIFPTFLLSLLDRGELVRGDHAGLVDHHVLAVAHRLDRDPGALARDAGGHDQLHLGVLEQRARVGDPPEIGKTLDEAFERHRVVPAVVADALGAEVQKPADLMVDVAMVEPDRGELQGRMVGHGRIPETGVKRRGQPAASETNGQRCQLIQAAASASLRSAVSKPSVNQS